MNNNKKNSFDKEIDELKEMQDNRYNPGYYIGTGRTPRYMRGISKKPKLLIIYGIFMLIFSILAVIINHDFDGIIILLVLSIIFIIGGLQRLYYKI